MMNSKGVSLFFLVFSQWVATVQGSGGNFLEKRISTTHIRGQIDDVVSEVLGNGHAVESGRIQKIRGTLAPMFRSLPKNKKGNIAAPVMRYTVRRYFSQQNAWIVKGFEPHADVLNTSSSEDVVQAKIPEYIRSVLEEQFSHDGFAFEDTVAMVAAVERLAFDEVVKNIEKAFYLNDFDVTASLTKSQLMDVVTSYLMIEMLEGTDNKSMHQTDKEQIRERYPHWDATCTFLLDVVGSDMFERRDIANPFVEEETFKFEDAVRMSESVSEKFGTWSNHECREMRDILTQYDIHNTGRVKISDFYRSTAEGVWQFLEPTQFLRQNGALDESSSYLGPQVIIANYIAGMSNCITSAPYYSICCLNDCDQVYQHLEDRIGARSANTSQIMAAVESLPQYVNVTNRLHAKLDAIATVSNGQVPLHGRLMAQWLHFVFPHECPYPHMGGLNPKTQEQWRAQVGEDAEGVTPEEVEQHLEAESSRREASPDAGEGMWLLHEMVMESSTPSDAEASMLKTLRMATMLSIVICFGFLVAKELNRIISREVKKGVEYDV